MFSRRDWLRLSASGAATVILARRLPALAPPEEKITVYKSPTCGCCHNWVEYMKRNGFTVTAHDLPDDKLSETKDTFGIPATLRSCHVALTGPYVFEGHIPVDLVRKVLKEKPKLAGLTVPGMPVGSPGMEMGGRKDKYEVVAFDKSGKTWVYASR
jgi:hypothetical protein